MRRLVLALLLAGPALFAQAIGNVANLVPAASITREKKTADAKVADPVWLNDVLRTDKAGRMRLKLQDGSLLTVGSAAELRVAKHDANAQQSEIELLYGAVRGEVQSVTRKGGYFTIKTPTASIGVIGTIVGVDTHVVNPVSTISDDKLKELPINGRDFSSLAQLTPGAGGPSISDYKNVDWTTVWSEDHLVFVRNIDPKVQGSVILMPFEYTEVRAGQPPTPPRKLEMPKPNTPFHGFDWIAKSDLQLGSDTITGRYLFNRGNTFAGSAPYDLAGGYPMNVPALSQAALMAWTHNLSTKITGAGTSTGNVFHVHVENKSSEYVRVIVPAGSILKPTGFWERKLVGTLLGGNPDIKSFQIMMSEGGTFLVPPAQTVVASLGGGEEPTPGTLDFDLRGFCLELHKLAPHPSTKYEFADPDQVEHFDPDRRILNKVYQMFYGNQLASQYHGVDQIAQWTLWAFREKMDAKRFKEEFTNLVHKNYDAQKKKWDKATQHQVEAWADDLWAQADKVLTAEKAEETANRH
jgi:FecR-like protein